LFNEWRRTLTSLANRGLHALKEPPIVERRGGPAQSFFNRDRLKVGELECGAPMRRRRAILVAAPPQLCEISHAITRALADEGPEEYPTRHLGQ